MQRAAEISAQVFTAKNLILRGTLEELRVGFLLFDSAIETLMVRRIRELSHWRFTSDTPSWIPQDRQVKADLSDMGQIQSEKARRPEGAYIHWSFSKSQIGKIEKDFSEKLRFLAWQGDIPSEYVGAISRLHEYRNEMYHREESRPEGLRIVAHLYASITGEFLDLLKPRTHSWGPDSAATRVRIYERVEMEPPELGDGSYDSGAELQSLMATTLRRDLELGDMPVLIADYIASRVRQTHDLLEYAREFVASMQRRDLSEMDAIRLAYWAPPGSSVQHKIPTRAMLKRWDEWAEGTRTCSDALTSFQSLADFESEFEDFERIVSNFVAEVDAEVDRQIDDAKERRYFGKVSHE